MSNLNPNCSGGRCRHPTGEVRMYPLSNGGNLILCHACWAHENRFRYQRGQETKRAADWPQRSWDTAEVYDG